MRCCEWEGAYVYGVLGVVRGNRLSMGLQGRGGRNGAGRVRRERLCPRLAWDRGRLRRGDG
jgi:hypothetical protein